MREVPDGQRPADLHRSVLPAGEPTGNLQKVYTALLNGTDDSTVVVLQYNLSDPWFTSFKNWQVETMVDSFNSQIATAVANTRQALPGKSSRLVMIGAQVDPTRRSPTCSRGSTSAFHPNPR